MPELPPEMVELAIKIRNKFGPQVRAMNQSFFYKMMEEAEEYKGCYIAYWECRGVKSLFVYRKDRAPKDEEVRPWAEILFNDGEIHREIGEYHMWCVQGDVYTINTVADMAGAALANAAERDSNADAFDFDNTEVGKRLGHKLRNGTS